ncbi:hypothetical protein UPYG_G00300390 [Umbra pygmaea]|uniref:Uncharacterized protein n=1 Tax=Umbra pygmaea TaxID=75934 RepID=A0ABD0WRA0_UMBPY
MKKSRSVLAVTPADDLKEPPGAPLSGSTLGVDLRRGRRRHSGTLLLPPLSWRLAERDLSRGAEVDTVDRPTTLPFQPPPLINITRADPDR